MRNHRNHRGLVVFVLGLVLVLGCGRTEKPPAERQSAEAAVDSGQSDSPSVSKPAPGRRSKDGPSAEKILQKMVKAYKYTPSYSDAGRVRMAFEADGQLRKGQWDFTAALVRPNKLRLQCNQGEIVCDGKTFYGRSASLPRLVLRQPAPSVLGPETLLGDVVLSDSMAQGPSRVYSWLPVQMVLLLADDPLKTLLYQATETQSLRPGKIGDYDCYRVGVSRPDGKGVFWIDRKTFALRRFEYPVELLRVEMGLAADAELALVADFTGAQLGGRVDPETFGFEMPRGAKVVSELVPASIALLGNREPDFFFVGLDNKPLTRNLLADKIAVMTFWATSCRPCRETLPEVQRLYENYKDNDKVRFLAVSIDDPRVPNADVEKVAGQLGLSIPVYRDSQRHADSALAVTGVPTTIILGPKGVVQAYQRGGGPMVLAQTVKAVKTLLDGKDVFPEQRGAFDRMVAQNQQFFDEMIRRDVFVNPTILQEEILQSSLAEKSKPKVMKLDALWTCREIEMPGNLLPLVDSRGQARLLVINAGREIVELDARGAVAARHELALPPEEYIAFLRLGVGADGRRRYVGQMPGMQQFHVFDENWKRLLSFPADAHKFPHAGIGDVQIADLDGDGTVEICVGYRDVVGVKGVSLTGDVLWSQRTFANIFKMAAGGPEADGRRRLFCTNDQVSLVALDGQGKVVGKLDLGGQLLYWIAAADLDRDGRTEMCGLAAPKLSENRAIGLTPDGQLAWNYELPKGLPGLFVELVLPAWLRADRSGQWLLVGADGSLHVVSAEGKPIDRFNYGELIVGVASVELDGKSTLLVSTRGKVEAWSVTWPGDAAHPKTGPRP